MEKEKTETKFKYKQIKSPLFDDFASMYPERRRGFYKSTFSIYFSEIDADPSKYFKPKKQLKSYENDIKTFFEKQKNFAPLTIRLRLNTVRLFMNYNKVPIDYFFTKKLLLSMPEQGPIGIEYNPTKGDIQKILMYCNVRERCWILICCSSGMRIREVLRVPVKNIFLDEDPVRIVIPGNIAKNKRQRTTFVTHECAEVIREWLRCREEYINNADQVNKVRNNTGRPRNMEQLIPFEYRTVEKNFIAILKKAGLYKKDERTKWSQLHVHLFKKFAKTQMQLAKLNPEMINAMVAHEPKYMAQYDRFSNQDLANEYKKAESYLSIYEVSQDLSGITENLLDKDQRLFENEKKIKKLMDALEIIVSQTTDTETKKKIEKMFSD